MKLYYKYLEIILNSDISDLFNTFWRFFTDAKLLEVLNLGAHPRPAQLLIVIAPKGWFPAQHDLRSGIFRTGREYNEMYTVYTILDVHIHLYLYTFVLVYICTCIHLHIYIYMMCIYIYVYIYIWYIYINSYIHASISFYLHTICWLSLKLRT